MIKRNNYRATYELKASVVQVFVYLKYFSYSDKLEVGVN